MTDKSTEPLFTCISCTIAFPSADEQRTHYRSDHHRYNMKRRVAGLPPISAALFNQKVLERRAETAVMPSLKGSVCDVCNKTYTTENAYRSHINSKRHKDNEIKAAAKERTRQAAPAEPIVVDDPAPPKEQLTNGPTAPVSLLVDPDANEDEINDTIDRKIAAARSKLSTSHCLFCPRESSSLEINLTHMSSMHSFFVPDADYLTDIEGLIQYLGEKISVGNVCIYCNEKGREFRTLDAVRKHMVDKAHCKIAYDNEHDRLEVSDYYDFSSSYPTVLRRNKKPKPSEDEDWEDMDEDDEDDSDSVDEVVDEEVSTSEDESGEDDEDLESGVAYEDTPYELVLPSGARLLHKSLHKDYRRALTSRARQAGPQEPTSGVALVRELLAQKNSALVPRKGGFGAFGQGTEVVKARNAGEAKEAGRHIREFRDQKRRENFKTKVGFRHNYQKHYRDPLLQ